MTAAGPDRPTFRPIFVVGHPRSGTTLLASMLGRDPEVAATPETLYLLQGRFQVAPALRAGPAAVAERIHRTPLRRLAPDRAALAAALAEVRAGGAPLDARGVFAALLELHARAQAKPRALEKTPLHIRHIDEILAWFPDAKVVWILRDGRACVASLGKVGWAADDPRRLARDWVRNMAFALDSEARADPRSLVRVRYEDLVADPVATLDRLQDFLGLPRSAAVHDHSLQAGTIKPFERAWKENVNRPIMSRRSDAWKDEIDVAALSPIMNPMLARLGYPAGPMPARAGAARTLAAFRRRLTESPASLALWRAAYPSLKGLKERLRRLPPAKQG
jgi:hypothetical protein